MTVVRRTDDGMFVLDLSPDERDIVRSLLKELRDLMVSGDSSVARLFPPAFMDDPGRQQDYDNLMRNELMGSHLDALNTMESTLDDAMLTEPQAYGWVRGLNELRLVLGTNLNVDEDIDVQELDIDDPTRGAYFLYDGMGDWLDDFLHELEPTLPPPTED